MKSIKKLNFHLAKVPDYWINLNIYGKSSKYKYCDRKYPKKSYFFRGSFNILEFSRQICIFNQLLMLVTQNNCLKNIMNSNHKIRSSYKIEINNFECNRLILVSDGCINESVSQGRSYIDGNISIYDCLFVRSSQYSGTGGVIYVLNGLCSMNISNSMFYRCNCSLDGGAIYSFSSNSDLRMICAKECSCNSHYIGQFAYISSSNMNIVDYLSISDCAPHTIGNCPILLSMGSQEFLYSNVSMNHACEISGMQIDSPLMFSSCYCNFASNIVSDSMCLDVKSCTGIFSFSNFINNNSPQHSSGVITISFDSPKIHYCIFQKNQNLLFLIHQASLDLSHCFISHNDMTHTGINNSFTFRQSYDIVFIEYKHCNGLTEDIKPNPSKNLVIRWILYVSFTSALLYLIFFAFENHEAARAFRERHQLEESLQTDFG